MAYFLCTGGNGEDLQVIAEPYDSSATYNENDVVIYEGLTYQCKNNSTTGTWDADKWDRIYLEELSPSTEEEIVVGENLLDNPFFEVNQRNVTSVSANNDYIADRWKVTSVGGASITNTNGLIKINPTGATSYCAFRQMFENDETTELLGKTLTLSVLFSNGEVYNATSTIDSSLPSSSSKTYCKIDFAQNQNVYYRVYSTGLSLVEFYNAVNTTDILSIKAVKLELGDVSTLVYDSAPDITMERLKCGMSTADSTDTYANKAPVLNSNENLLDNPFFNVNSRGQSSYSNVLYTVDRWFLGAVNQQLDISNDGMVTLSKINGSTNAQLHQIINVGLDELLGKTITLSAILDDYSIVSMTTVIKEGMDEQLRYANDRRYLSINTKAYPNKVLIRHNIAGGSGALDTDTMSCRSMKLELGNVSTLKYDSAPNVNDERIKCQLSTADVNDTYANMIIIKCPLNWSTIKYLTMSSSSASYDSSTKTIDFTTTSASNNGLQAYFTIDVTSISTITIYYSLTLYATYSGQAIGVCTSVPSTAGTLPTYLKSTALASGTNKTATLDVSSYTGEVYIDINLTASSGKITNIIFS